MLNFLADRPAVLSRFPNGIDKEGFYEKDALSALRMGRKIQETF